MSEVQPLLVSLVVLLLTLLGKALKEWKAFPSELIPRVLGIVGGLVGWYVFKDAAAVTSGLASVGLHQFLTQGVNKNDNQNTSGDFSTKRGE